MSNEEENELITRHCDQLAEHFDTVQIFVTRHEAGLEDGTISRVVGAGSWFARQGQIIHWLAENNERTRTIVRKETE